MKTAPPPQAFPQILEKAKRSYRTWFSLYQDFPRTHLYTLGSKIEENFLTLLEHIFFALYLDIHKKIIRLEYAIAKLDALKFFFQLAYENKCLSEKKYLELAEQLQEIGRMLGGWKKGLEKKILAQKTPETN